MQDKGMLVFVYRCAAFGDTSNSGPSSRYSRAILYQEKIPNGNIFALSHDTFPLMLMERGDYLYTVPFNIGHFNEPSGSDKKWRMFGGNFVYSSDSRFRDVSVGPLPVHDRVE